MKGIDAGKQFLDTYRAARVLLAPHPDADGLGGAAILWRTLQGKREVISPQKGISIHAEEFRTYLQRLAPEALIIIDQGSRAEAVLPDVPTMTVDHHVPGGTPPGVYVTSYPDTVASSAAHLCYLLAGEPDDLLWLAALGTIGDFGANVGSFPFIAEANNRYTQTALVETVALINAARRSSRFDWQHAFRVLVEANSPREIVNGDLPGVAQLTEDRSEVTREAQRARKSRPFLADPWAVIPFSSPCLVHGMVATSWVNRLSDHYVVAANYGYRPGYVHFSVRAALQVDLVQQLRALVPEGLPGEWAHGHHAATGGALTRQDFLILLNHMGFPPHQTVEIEDIALRPR